MRKCYNDHNHTVVWYMALSHHRKRGQSWANQQPQITQQKEYDGEGTVNQRKDGRWEYRVSLGKVNGKYAYKSFYAATERELKKLIKQYNSDRQKYLCEADKTPFWQHAEPLDACL